MTQAVRQRSRPAEAKPFAASILDRGLAVPRVVRDDFPILDQEVHGKPLVYLDSAATSQKPRAMIERLQQVYAHEYARVEEGHTLSREATRARS